MKNKKLSLATLFLSLFSFLSAENLEKVDSQEYADLIDAVSVAEDETYTFTLGDEENTENSSSGDLLTGSESESEGGESSGEEDDFDSLFAEAEDLEEGVKTEDKKAGTDYNVQLGSIKFPIEFSGHMATDFGTAYVREGDENDGTFYFDFKNYFYLTVRPDKYLALKAVLKSSLPDCGDKEENEILYPYELYFDYLMFNHIYFTAGKKSTVWGNIRLFSNADDYGKSSNPDSQYQDDAMYTNIVYDSRDYISGTVKFMFFNQSISGLAMYDPDSSGTSPKTKDMSLAINGEFVLFNTSLNLLLRRFPDDSEKQTIFGFELKKTLFKFDLYGQALAHLADASSLKKIVTSKFSDFSAISKVVGTAGTYRVWDDLFSRKLGFNFEYQLICNKANEDKYVHRFASDVGLSKLGPKKNIKIGGKWNHNITTKEGLWQVAIFFTNVLPHCDWRNVAEYKYYDSSSSNKLTLGTYLNITLDY